MTGGRRFGWSALARALEKMDFDINDVEIKDLHDMKKELLARAPEQLKEEVFKLSEVIRDVDTICTKNEHKSKFHD